MRNLAPASEKARNRSTKSRCTVAALFERPRELGEHLNGGEALLDRQSFVFGIEFFKPLVTQATKSRPRLRAPARSAVGKGRIIHISSASPKRVCSPVFERPGLLPAVHRFSDERVGFITPGALEVFGPMRRI